MKILKQEIKKIKLLYFIFIETFYNKNQNNMFKVNTL